MGRRGPPRTPTETLRLRGSKLAKQRADVGFKPVRQPHAPRTFDRFGREIWRKLAGMLGEAQVLTEADLAVLQKLVLLEQEITDLTKVIEEEGLTVSVHNEDGSLRYVGMHPAVKHRTRVIALYLRVAERFGLTPAARPQVAPHAEPQESDPLSDLLSRGDEAEDLSPGSNTG